MILELRKKILATVRAGGAAAMEHAQRSARASAPSASGPDDSFQWTPVGLPLPQVTTPHRTWLVELRDRYRQIAQKGANPFFSPDHVRRGYDDSLRQAADTLASGVIDRVLAHIQSTHDAGSWPFGEAALGRLRFPAAATVDVSDAFEKLPIYAGGGRRLDAALRSKDPGSALGTVLIQLNSALAQTGLALVDCDLKAVDGAIHCEVVVRDLPMLALALALDPETVRPDPRGMQPIDDVGLERLHLEEQSRRVGARLHFEH